MLQHLSPAGDDGRDQPGGAGDYGAEHFVVWSKYEDIAMHFNDLLIKLRTQALAGVAALSTIVSIFTKYDQNGNQGSWEIAAGVFGALCLFWVAIWILDLLYYNRLLIGSVVALFELEELSKQTVRVKDITMSTRIGEAVGNSLPKRRLGPRRSFLLRGVWAFYVIVFIALVLGFIFSLLRAWPALARMLGL